MGTDTDTYDREASRRHRDDDRSEPRRRRSRDRDADRRRSRDGSEHRGGRQRDRRRSQSPHGSSRRHGSRDRDRGDRDRDRAGMRDSHREERRERDGERSSRRRRNSPDAARSDRHSRRHDHRDMSPISDRVSHTASQRKQSPLRRRGPLPSQEASFAVDTGDLDEPPKPKEQPNFGNSGSLAKAANSIQQADGSVVTLKYHEPPEARKPPARDDWKLFVFKGSDVVDTIGLSARSCWLVGREATVVDILAEHPSLSKQHAVLQFRYIEKRNEFGDKIGRVRPYLIDLESANKTLLNGKKIAESRYIEVRDKDVIQFGHSTREYVVMLAPRN